MSFEVTATRRRPQQFETLAGQEFVVSTLKNAIEQGRIAHAYLFSGPRGVGKTTSARLLAKALNCVNGPTSEPCGECENCKGIARGNNLDVIEIDGASNTGVNDVRVIKEEVMFPPTSSRYKIYIIDEVHMLSQSAFNALLKTIEEPPEYVVFIFATTEPQKVPATIRSRCQQFNFQLIPLETVKKLLREACEEMGIEAEDEALFWIAKESTGSMRDAYTLFDQVVSFSNGKITLDQIKEKLGLVGIDRINNIMKDILANNNVQATNQLQDLLAKSVSVDQIIKDFTDYMRSLLLIKQGIKSENILGETISSFPEEVVKAYNIEQLEAGLDMLLNLYRDIRYSINPRFELELAIAKLSRLRFASSNSVVIEQIARLKNELLNGSITPTNPNLNDIPSVSPERVEEVKNIAEPCKEEPQAIVEELGKKEFSDEDLKAVLPMGVKATRKNEFGLVLEFDSKFYYQNVIRNMDEVRDKIQKVVGKDTNVVIEMSEKEEKIEPKEMPNEMPHEKPVEPKVEVKPQAIPTAQDIDDQKKYFVEDLITAFRGQEEK